MTDTSNGAVKTVRNGHAHPDERNCPTCGSVIPLTVYAAILGRLNAHDVEIEKKAEQAVAARFMRQIAEAERKKKTEIATAIKTVEAKLKSIRDNQASAVAAAVEVERQKSGKAVAEAVAVAKIEFATEKARLEADLSLLQKKVAARPAHQIGEPAEVDLFDTLVAAFPGDDISRVPKGVPGPDIVHRINPSGCVLVYDSKAHKVWSNRWTAKLRDDMKRMSPPAEHGVLVSSVFPRGEHHGLMLRDGIVVVSPSRVLPVAHILRKQAIQLHALALSSEQRDGKTAQIYLLLTSNQTADLWARHDEALEHLLEIEGTDSRHQQKTRDQRIETVGSLRAMIRDDLVASINTILGGGS